MVKTPRFRVFQAPSIEAAIQVLLEVPANKSSWALMPRIHGCWMLKCISFDLYVFPSGKSWPVKKSILTPLTRTVAQEFLHDLHASIHNTYNICLTLIQMTPPSPKIPQSLYLPHGHLVFCETAIGLPMARVNSPFRRLWTSRFWPFWCEWLGAMTQQATQKESLRRMNIYKGTGRREREREKEFIDIDRCVSRK